MASQNSLSVIIPALNEEAHLEGAVACVLEAAKRHFDDYEIIIIDDGSSDRTPEIADRLRDGNKRIQVLHHERPRNLGGAYRSGLTLARMFYVTAVNGKHDTTPAELGRVWRLKGAADMIVPYSADHAYRHPFRRFASKAFTALINALFGLKLRYYNHAVLHKRELVRSIRIRTDSYAFQAELLIKLLKRGHSYVEVEHGDKSDNEGGSRSYTWRNIWGVTCFFLATLYDVHVTDRYRPRRSPSPDTGRSVPAVSAVPAPAFESVDPVNLWKTEVGEPELAGMIESVRARRLSQGPVTEEFERRLAAELGVPYVVLTPSGSSALLLALMACDVRPGDEAIVPNRTFMATANAPLLLGLKVRLADVEPGRPVLSVPSFERAITDRTKVVLPVHLNGRAADMVRIREIAAARGIKVIEDAAQAMFSRSGQGCLGTLGDLGAFSMSVAKLITTGQGGFVAARDQETYERLQRLKNHGSIGSQPERYDRFGFNFKFTDILAGMGLRQLDRLAAKLERHRSLYRFYEQAIRDLPFLRMIEVNMGAGELPLWIEVYCSERKKVIGYLNEQGIFPRAFLPSLNEAEYLQDLGDFPNSIPFSIWGLTLPCGPDQPEEHLERTVKCLRELSSLVRPLPESLGSAR